LFTLKRLSERKGQLRKGKNKETKLSYTYCQEKLPKQLISEKALTALFSLFSCKPYFKIFIKKIKIMFEFKINYKKVFYIYS